ncbi:AbiH family protein [Alistipes sp.]|uniref:AbiH family protein n=1 Tax=Alistipes sp. TaxID=1872444 RepID=UPI003AAAFB6E
MESYKRDNDELSKHIKKIIGNEQNIARYYHLPDQILLLNFNYTSTANLYIPQGSEFKVNHIHGELGNDNNPIIFGYGDELDEDYKSIANLNDNEYLKNIKSIRYLETDNYRQLLRFIDSAPYQIYVMGHSCGNSDRTLLNTLFEHRNCLSIKPYYHKKADGTDNYIDIVQNISRDFNDMTLMRDRVVNKGYCRPLVEPTH